MHKQWSFECICGKSNWHSLECPKHGIEARHGNWLDKECGRKQNLDTNVKVSTNIVGMG